MADLEAFLTQAEEQEIIEAIRLAEKNTSGEIRVHLEHSHKTTPLERRALEVFHLLKMDNTALKNGVLIYVAVDDRDFIIYGDKGIHAKVGQGFWDSTRDTIQDHFKKGKFKQGLVAGVLEAGKALSIYFPWQQGDINELPDEISKG
ncbi:TPM domain-containing protein [Gangjinia marincola]|uniref:TPM domain-containing protein n=1 Tax=Gangjinia marincola TaxID=578463 RepID=A0ABP3XQ24_9FLAO